MKKLKHKHHIVPKHAGGTNDSNNIIELSIKEHAEAHHLLFEKYGRIEDKLAWLGLIGEIGYDELILSLLKRPKSDEHKKKISQTLKGRKMILSPEEIKKRSERGKINFKGKKHKEESLEKIRKKRREQIFPDNYSETLSLAQKKRWNKLSSKDRKLIGNNISNAKKGKKTNQMYIMGKKYASMTDEEFEKYISTKSPKMEKRFKNIRERFIENDKK